MEKKTVINNALLAAAAMNLTNGFARAPSKDPRYFELRQIMREYVEKIAAEECAGFDGYTQDTYDWNDYEIAGLQIVLLDLVNHTKNYCKPPELKGMYSTSGQVEDH